MSKCSVKPQVGDPAPVLTLPTADGTHFCLTDAAGHPALISFLSHAA